MGRTDDGTPSPDAGAADPLERPGDAAHWFARMQSGETSAQDRRDFDAWCAADPAHLRDYRRLLAQWQVAALVPRQRLHRLMQAASTPAVPPDPSRRRFGLAAGALALAAAAGLAAHALRPTDRVSLALATPQGERREVILPDGSTVHLNAATELAVRFDHSQRHVELLRGEAFFTVRHDAGRPFVVDGGLGQVTVTGTRFDVRRDADALRVTVASGSVRLQSGPWWHAGERRLTAGQQALAYADRTLSEAVKVDVDQSLAWQRGKVIFNDAPLATVIDEMNRYLPQPARLQALGLAQYRVSGIFGVDDPDALLDALPAIAPVTVLRLGDGRVAVLAR
ncbi:FecR family protein [Verticiella sediminum]|uniref:FecR family protein n=1 Tax=Verticiella sediminum TaxID=1247510 RepID=A0A556AIU6_9BURK|nr:FecR family protein [Verticiella sediminum]TSH92828.1 FecR family protein [Verticiella sediminum]